MAIPERIGIGRLMEEDVQRVQNESLQFTLTTLSNSALMHARGNSGNYFQFFVAFCEAIIQSEDG